MITEIRHFGIQTPFKDKFNQSIKFYKLLGLKKIYHKFEDWGIVFGKIEVMKLSDNNISIELIYRQDLIDLDLNNYFGCHIAFTIKNLEVMCKKIEKKGGTIVITPRLSPDKSVKLAFCYDPNGVSIELVEELK